MEQVLTNKVYETINRELRGRMKHTCLDILKVEMFLHPYEDLHILIK
jgi:hypothetical protein